MTRVLMVLKSGGEYRAEHALRLADQIRRHSPPGTPPHMDVCPECEGCQTANTYDGLELCPRCGGSGQVPHELKKKIREAQGDAAG